MKIDLKSWMLIILIVICGVLTYLHFNKSDDNAEIKKSEEKIEILQQQRDSIMNNISNLKKMNIKNDSLVTYYQDKLAESNTRYISLEADYKVLNKNLDIYISKINDTKNTLNNISNLTPKTDTVLLNSLKNKLK